MSSEVQIAVIDQQDTQIVLAVPGVQGATGSEIAAGGTANQVLRKASSTNYDTNWSLVTNAMVDSSAAIAGTKISPNFGSQNVVTTGTSTAASFIPTSSSVPTNGVYLPSANNVAISTNGTGRLFVDASGNVGVGNSAPGSLLTVRSASSPTISVENNTSTGFGAVLFRNGGTNYGLQSRINLKALITDTATGASALTFETSTGDLAAPTERMRLDSSGRLGLGTSSPSVNLHISSSSSPKLRIADPGTSATSFGQSNSGLELVGGNANTTAKYMPAIKFGSTDSAFTTTTPKFGAAITAEASEAYDADTDGGMSLAFWTTPNDPGTGGSLQQRLTILNSGNVGIGVTAPSALLSLYAGANSEYFRGGGNGATTRDLVISASTGANAGDTHTINASGATGQLIFSTASNERARIDSSGRLLVGTSSARSNLGGGAQSARLQIEGTTGDTARISQIQNANSSNAIQYIFAKSRGTAVGSNTIVQSGDGIGQLSFEGSDGTNFVQAASITGAVDGTPGADDMPGRLVFSVTQDTQSSPTEALRITNDRVRCYNQAAPAAVDTTATLTVGNLKTGIITSSTAAAVTMTLPTGTDTEAGFSNVYTNMTFEWTVINTGATNAVTVQGGTGHTLVGSGAVAAGVSGRFASRRTASNTFVTYRLS
jgi:hypothetical protein